MNFCLALDPVRVDLVTGLPHDDVVDLVARRPARRRSGLESGAEQALGVVLRGVDREELVEGLRGRAGEDLLVVPEETLDLGLDHQLVVLAADDADVRVVSCAAGRGGQRGIRALDVRVELIAERGLDRLQGALAHPALDLGRVRRAGRDVRQVGSGSDAVGDLVGRVAVGRDVDLDPGAGLERLQDVLEGLELGAAPGGPDGDVGRRRGLVGVRAARRTGGDENECAEAQCHCP